MEEVQWPTILVGFDFLHIFEADPSEKYESVGMMTFPTEWKVIKFHGSKPPISNDSK